MKTIRLNNVVVKENATIIDAFGFIIPNEGFSIREESYASRGIADKLSLYGIKPKSNEYVIQLWIGGSNDDNWSHPRWWEKEKVEEYKDFDRYYQYFPKWFPKELFKDVKEGDIVEIVSPKGSCIFRIKLEQLKYRYKSFGYFEEVLETV